MSGNFTFQKSFCSRCNKAIAWIPCILGRTTKMHPINWGQVENWESSEVAGNIVFVESKSVFRAIRDEALKSFIRLGGWVFKSHFETCPFAHEFKNRKRK